MKALALLISVFCSGLVHAQSVEEGRYFGAFGGYGLASSTLTGQGFNADLAPSGGLSYGIEGSYQTLEGDNWYQLSILRSASKSDSPSGFTPAQINQTREDYRFLYVSPMSLEAGPDSFRFGLGYRFLKNGGTATTPNNLVTERSLQGLVIAGLWRWRHKSGISWFNEVGLFLPHRMTEAQQATGYSANLVGLDWKSLIEFTLGDEIIGYVGLTASADSASFSGTAERGVSGAVDTRKFINFPAGIKVGF